MGEDLEGARVLERLRRDLADASRWVDACAALRRGAPAPGWLRDAPARRELARLLAGAETGAAAARALRHVLELEPVAPDPFPEAFVGQTLVDRDGVPYHLASGAPLAARCRRTGATYRWVPPSHAGEELASFVPGAGVWIGEFPVTVASYADFLAATGAAPPGGWERQAARPERPVVHVSWEEAREFSAWAGGRLPLASEWRRACADAPAPPVPRPERGGPLYRFTRGLGPTLDHGVREPPPDLLEGLETCLEGIPEISVRGRSRFGLAGCRNRIWQWCLDWESAPVHAPYLDPLVLSNYRIRKGGSWLVDGEARDARDATVPGWSGLTTGFRVARPLADPDDLDPTWAPPAPEDDRG